MVRAAAPDDEPASRRPGQASLRSIAIVIVLAVLAYAVLQVVHALPGWLDPFGEKTKDRSGPAVLRSIQNISRYEAATGDFQVIVDLEKDARFLPGSIRGERTLFVGTGN